MRKHIKFTKEEKEEDIQLVLEYLKKGQSYSKIAEDLGRSIQYIANIKKVLISSLKVILYLLSFLFEFMKKHDTIIERDYVL